MDLEMVCRVCDDKASGVHYGVESCEGCKGFYRRTIHQRIKYQECALDGSCNITRATRNRCQICRYRKCINLGMSRDAVKFGRIPCKEKAKKFAERMALRRNLMVVQGNEESACSLQRSSSAFTLKDEISERSGVSPKDHVVPPGKWKLDGGYSGMLNSHGKRIVNFNHFNVVYDLKGAHCSRVQDISLANFVQSRTRESMGSKLWHAHTTYVHRSRSGVPCTNNANPYLRSQHGLLAHDNKNGITTSQTPAQTYSAEFNSRMHMQDNVIRMIHAQKTQKHIEQIISHASHANEKFHGYDITSRNKLKLPPRLLYISRGKTGSEVSTSHLQENREESNISLSSDKTAPSVSPYYEFVHPVENIPDEFSRKPFDIVESHMQRAQLDENKNLYRRSKSFDIDRMEAIPRWSLQRNLSGDEMYRFSVNRGPQEGTTYHANPINRQASASTNSGNETDKDFLQRSRGLLTRVRSQSSSPGSECPENKRNSAHTNMKQQHGNTEKLEEIPDLYMRKQRSDDDFRRSEDIGDELLRAHNETMFVSKHAVLLTLMLLKDKGSKQGEEVMDSTIKVNEARLITGLEDQLDLAVIEVVEFSKRIPGFTKLNEHDQLTLLKSGMFEVLILRFSSQYQSETSTFLFPNQLRFSHKQLANNGLEGFVKSTFDFAEKLHHLGLNAKEYSIFTTLPLVSSDRLGLIDTKSVDELQNSLLVVLRHQMSLSWTEKRGIAFPKLLTKLAELRTLSILSQT